MRRFLFTLSCFLFLGYFFLTAVTGPVLAQQFSDVFGTIDAPQGVSELNANSGNSANIGLITFMSRLIQIATIVAGVIVFVNFILAGFTFITSDGNANTNEKVKNQITMSVVGLVLIVISYTIIAALSLLLFGDAGFILSPTF